MWGEAIATGRILYIQRLSGSRKCLCANTEAARSPRTSSHGEALTDSHREPEACLAGPAPGLTHPPFLTWLSWLLTSTFCACLSLSHLLDLTPTGALCLVINTALGPCTSPCPRRAFSVPGLGSPPSHTRQRNYPSSKRGVGWVAGREPLPEGSCLPSYVGKEGPQLRLRSECGAV
jgi:hypothetical protein